MQGIWGNPRDDVPALGLATMLGLCDAIAANEALRSVCSDGNSSVQDVARDIALSVIDYIANVQKTATAEHE